MSDHCPISVVFETDDTIEPSDAITVLLGRLDAVQVKLTEQVAAARQCQC